MGFTYGTANFRIVEFSLQDNMWPNWTVEIPVNQCQLCTFLNNRFSTFADNTEGQNNQVLQSRYQNSLFRLDGISGSTLGAKNLRGTVTLATGTKLVQLGTLVGVPTATNATDTFNLVAHGLLNGARVHFATTTGVLPAGLSATTVYYVVSQAANTFKVSAAIGGAAVDITTDGTNPFSVYTNSEIDSTYFVTLGGTAAESFYVEPTAPARTKTNFTIKSSNAASTAIVDWHLIR